MKNLKFGIILLAIIYITNAQNIFGASLEVDDHKQLENNLSFAAVFGDTQKVRECLAKNVNVNAVDEYRYNALMYAAKHSHTEIIRLLLDYKQDDPENCANVKAVDDHGRNALMSAARDGQAEIVRILLEDPLGRVDVNAGETALLSAARCGHTEIVRMLLEYKQEGPI